jgi:hypothetical protein
MTEGMPAIRSTRNLVISRTRLDAYSTIYTALRRQIGSASTMAIAVTPTERR